MTLDHRDLKMALAAVGYFRRAHELSNMPVPPAADRLTERLNSMMSAVGQEDVAPQPNWLSTEELATRMDICPRQARRIAKRIGQKVGGRWWIPEENV
jgi:hypothetical protein